MHAWTLPSPASLGIAAILVLALAGCFRESDENTNEGTNPSGDAVAVEVRLTDDAIEMPAELATGSMLFEVTNVGTVPHGFAIEDVAGRIDELRPDQLETLRLELPPGTYTVFSPVEGDRESGLEVELTVTEPEDGGEAPLNDEGVGGSEEQEPIVSDPPE